MSLICRISFNYQHLTGQIRPIPNDFEALKLKWMAIGWSTQPYKTRGPGAKKIFEPGSSLFPWIPAGGAEISSSADWLASTNKKASITFQPININHNIFTVEELLVLSSDYAELKHTQVYMCKILHTDKRSSDYLWQQSINLAGNFWGSQRLTMTPADFINLVIQLIAFTISDTRIHGDCQK